MTLWARLTLATLALAGCGSGVDGKYYDTGNGKLVLELRGGRAYPAESADTATLVYTVTKNTVVIRRAAQPNGDALVYNRRADGTLDAGILGSIRRK